MTTSTVKSADPGFYICPNCDSDYVDHAEPSDGNRPFCRRCGSTLQREPERNRGRTGKRLEQARYQIPEGTRALVAQRVNGRVALVDVPIDYPGRVLLIEPHITSLAELEGIVAAYVEHSTHASMPGLLASRRLLDDLADQLEPDAA